MADPIAFWNTKRINQLLASNQKVDDVTRRGRAESPEAWLNASFEFRKKLIEHGITVVGTLYCDPLTGDIWLEGQKELGISGNWGSLLSLPEEGLDILRSMQDFK